MSRPANMSRAKSAITRRSLILSPGPKLLNGRAALTGRPCCCAKLTHRLSEALRLVIAGARPRARHHAAVSLRSWNVFRRGIAINFAAGIKKHAFDRRPSFLLRQTVIQNAPQTVDVRVHGRDGVLAVVGGGRDGCAMNKKM